MAGPAGDVIEERFRAMGSEVHVLVVGGSPEIVAETRGRIDELEERWSRFRPDSEVSQLNAASGGVVSVSDDTRLLVECAIEGWRRSGGAYDPLLLRNLERLGYTRSFDRLDAVTDRQAIAAVSTDSADIAASADVPDGWAARPQCTDIVIGPDGIALPAGAGFDPGGVGKGLASDLATERAMSAGAAGVCVSMGGDVRVRGTSPTGTGWTLAIEHPWVAEPIALVGLWDGAVATSSVLRRVWQDGADAHHHLIDPDTGTSAVTDAALAGVVAGDAWVAEVLAKSLLLRGRGRWFDLLDGTSAGVVVDHDGNVAASDRFADYLGGVALPERLALNDSR